MSTAVVIPFAPRTSEASVTFARYRNAYAASQQTSQFAETVALGGMTVAGVLWLGAVIAYQAIPKERSGFPTVTFIFIAVALWILLVSRVVRRGFLVQAHLLQAVTDSAVVASPFLSNRQRIEVMGLRRAPMLQGWECARVRDRALAVQHQHPPRLQPVWIWRKP